MILDAAVCLVKHKRAAAPKPDGHKCPVTNPGAAWLTVKGTPTVLDIWSHKDVCFVLFFLMGM